MTPRAATGQALRNNFPVRQSVFFGVEYIAAVRYAQPIALAPGFLMGRIEFAMRTFSNSVLRKEKHGVRTGTEYVY